MDFRKLLEAEAKTRGLSLDQAIQDLVCLLIIVSITRELPGRAVLIGGSALRFGYGSSRYSRDIDLVPTENRPADLLAALERIVRRERRKLQALLQEELFVNRAAASVQISDRTRVISQIQPVLYHSQTVDQTLRQVRTPLGQAEVILTATLKELLWQKAIALINRSHFQARDVYDIYFLTNERARLDADALADWIRWNEMEERLRERLGHLKPASFKSLQFVLPAHEYALLAEVNFKPVIHAVRSVFHPIEKRIW